MNAGLHLQPGARQRRNHHLVAHHVVLLNRLDRFFPRIMEDRLCSGGQDRGPHTLIELDHIRFAVGPRRSDCGEPP